MASSSDSLARPVAPTDGRAVPLVDFPRTAGLPAIRVEHWVCGRPHPSTRGTHAHDFLALFYLERGEQVLRVDGRDVALAAGNAFVVAPGAVVSPHSGPDVGTDETTGWMVFFPADAIDPTAAAPLVSWRTHPLLSPFVGNHRGGAQCLHIPPHERASWLARLAGLDAELRNRRDGYADAARAHLTLLLVHLGRLHWDAPAERGIEPLLAAVFDVIEARSHEPISLRDVADAVGLTPGHLTTAIGRRTGRTVQQWITERRMREARRLLADTDLAVGESARRGGYREAGSVDRRFRAAHGVPPAAWRRAGRPA